MANTETQNLDALLHEIAQEQGESFTYNRAKIEEEAQQSNFQLSRLAMKVLTILGGLLASSTFLGFLAAAGLYDSPVAIAVVGAALLVGAESLIRSKTEAAADSIGVSLNIIGYILLGMGVGQLTDNATAVACVLGGAAALVVVLSRSAICVFFGVLVLNGSLLGLLVIHKIDNAAHLHIALLAAILTYISLNEARLISLHAKLNAKYSPVLMGVVFSLLLMLALLVHQKFLSTAIGHFWISGAVLSLCLLLLVYSVMQHAGIKNTKTRVAIYTCTVLILGPTIVAPSVPGALLVLLSSFYIGHRPGFWVGLLALVYFVVMYYYDLNMTLLAKSGVLVASGLLFLGGFVLLNKFLKNDAD
ncbi:DUF4401 domain-containing protein [uncultured Pontibacter sp.]|uniref:DUF4401 domain-containing protein n=1 Tax=uncultured Pontibacter sp. TaxID=453356 RepID=UPI00262B3F86|nr:DUF4401 domain-containing protein [uncultured Pontibacter sp.]